MAACSCVMPYQVDTVHAAGSNGGHRCVIRGISGTFEICGPSAMLQAVPGRAAGPCGHGWPAAGGERCRRCKRRDSIHMDPASGASLSSASPVQGLSPGYFILRRIACSCNAKTACALRECESVVVFDTHAGAAAEAPLAGAPRFLLRRGGSRARTRRGADS